jgi:hypothetical protein
MASTGTMSDYLANMLLNASVGDGTFTEPTNVYLTFATTTIVAGDDATTIDEPDEGSPAWSNFARKEITAANWNAAASRAKTTSIELDFGTATTTGDVDMTDWCIVDAASGAGNMLWYGTLDGTITVQNGNPVTVPIGDVDIAVSTALGTPS